MNVHERTLEIGIQNISKWKEKIVGECKILQISVEITGVKLHLEIFINNN